VQKKKFSEKERKKNGFFSFSKIMAAQSGVKKEGNKWYVDNIKGSQDTVIEISEPKEVVIISNCSSFVVKVNGKCTGITANRCTQGGIIFDDIIGSVEVMNGKKIQLQANGQVPTIQIDKTEGATLYLQTAASQKADIITSLVSELNVILPGANPETDDPAELPAPSQFLTKVDGRKLITTPVEHVGV
jgi:adenylyl cyclase-associated protein